MTSTSGSGRAKARPGGSPVRRWWALVVALVLSAGTAATGCSDDSPASTDTPAADAEPGGDESTTEEQAPEDEAPEEETGDEDSGEDEAGEDPDDSSGDGSGDEGEAAGASVAGGLALPAEQVAPGSSAAVAGFAGAQWTVTIEAVDTTSYTDPTDKPCAVVSGTLTLNALADDRQTSSPGDLPVRFMLDADDREVRFSPFCQPEALMDEGHLPLGDLQVDVGASVPFYDSYDVGAQVPVAYVMGGGANDGWVSFAVG